MCVTVINSDNPFLSFMPALKKNVTIVNPLGLHARPAAQLAQTAQTANGPVFIHANSHKVDAKDVLEVLSLECHVGTRIIIEVEDPQDLTVLNKICSQLQNNLGETLS